MESGCSGAWRLRPRLGVAPSPHRGAINWRNARQRVLLNALCAQGSRVQSVGEARLGAPSLSRSARRGLSLYHPSRTVLPVPYLLGDGEGDFLGDALGLGEGVGVGLATLLERALLVVLRPGVR